MERTSQSFHLMHGDGPPPGLWNRYFALEPYKIINSEKIISPYEDKNLYIANCEFINLTNRAITVVSTGFTKILNSFCLFKGCSTQSSDGGGTYYVKHSDAVFYFCCALNSTSKIGGASFSYIETSKSNFETSFETCTISSCTSYQANALLIIYFANNFFLSSNFSKNEVRSYSCFHSSGQKTGIKCKYCSMHDSRASYGFISINFEVFFFDYCNVQNISDYYIGLFYINTCDAQIYRSCFSELTTGYVISSIKSSVNVINCSFELYPQLTWEGSQINTDKIGNEQFSFKLGHLVLAECDAPIQKTMEVFKIESNAFIKMKCSCQNIQRLFGLQSNIMPSIFFEYSILH